MRYMSALILGLLVVLGSSRPALSGPIPAPLQGVSVSVRVTQDPATSIFAFDYRIMNPPQNDGEIWSIDIDITRSAAEARLSRDGLVNGPRYLRATSEDALLRAPMVPVGITGPDEWIYGLGFDGRTPPRGFAGWGSGESSRIRPGEVRDGFRLTSPGLPGIRTTQVQPHVDIDNLPEEFVENVEKTRQLYDSLVFSTSVVGPKAPPSTFVAVEFLNYLIGLVHDSRQQGWIKVDGVAQSLLAKLRTAKRKLEASDDPTAKKRLEAFVHEVRAVSCSDFACPGSKPLTSEAYALLFFNGQYLLDRLP